MGPQDPDPPYPPDDFDQRVHFWSIPNNDPHFEPLAHPGELHQYGLPELDEFNSSPQAKEFWTEFRRASRKVPDKLQAAMVELADTGTCELDDAQGAELRRILATLAQPASPLITEMLYRRPSFWR